MYGNTQHLFCINNSRALTHIRKCRRYCCVPFSYAAIAKKKKKIFAVSVMQYAPSYEEWRPKLSDVQCNWLNGLSQYFPTQSFKKIHSVVHRFDMRMDGQNHFTSNSAETRKHPKQNVFRNATKRLPACMTSRPIIQNMTQLFSWHHQVPLLMLYIIDLKSDNIGLTFCGKENDPRTRLCN
jgi:hypothetical protein